VYSRVASHVLGDWNACGEEQDYDDTDTMMIATKMMVVLINIISIS
jgi:hypothetical protein